METICCIGLKSINLPVSAPLKVPKIEPKIKKTVTKIILSFGTQSAVNIIPKQESEYTDEQFHADLRKASKHLDSMVRQALKEDAEGKTREFPM
jgi:hypothetical protein